MIRFILPVYGISPPSSIKHFSHHYHGKRYGDSSRETRIELDYSLGRNVIKHMFSTRGGETSQTLSALETETKSQENTSLNANRNKKYLKLEQVQIIHRHGDRTPITPMRNETFWQNTIPSPEILKNIALGTKLVHDTSIKSSHVAKGRGAFGQLTTLGMFQMVDLGSKLRDELILVEAKKEESEGSESELTIDKKDGEIIIQNGSIYKLRDTYLFESQNSLSCDSLKVTSTDFPRTIQSVQALLIGLFPDGLPNKHPLSNASGTNPNTSIEIDIRHTDIMIPDPQPRTTIEQTNLEKKLSQRKYILEKEMQMKELAINVTKILKKDVLGHGYDEISFGVCEEKEEVVQNSALSTSSATVPLPWAQLSEITKCLAVRNMLPPDITPQMQHQISVHAAWRWFENLRHPRLAWLAMNGMTQRMMKNIINQSRISSDDSKDDIGTFSNLPRLHIYSAHDSTLIGLMCAFRLEQPAEWPEYASYLKLELYRVIDDDREIANDGKSNDNDNDNIEQDPKFFIRFSLNSRILRCYCNGEDDDPLCLVPVDCLAKLMDDDGAVSAHPI